MQNSIRFLVVSRMTKYCQETVKYGISLASKYGAQLFVLRHPEESKLEHFLFDRINEELLRRKLCPILFVKK